MRMGYPTCGEYGIHMYDLSKDGLTLLRKAPKILRRERGEGARHLHLRRRRHPRRRHPRLYEADKAALNHACVGPYKVWHSIRISQRSVRPTMAARKPVDSVFDRIPLMREGEKYFSLNECNSMPSCTPPFPSRHAMPRRRTLAWVWPAMRRRSEPVAMAGFGLLRGDLG